MLTREQAQQIVKNNNCFFCIEETIDNIQFEIYNYGLAGLMDFQNPLKQNPVEINAWDMRSLCFAKINNEWKSFLSLPKFFAINQTSGYHIKELQDKKIVGVYEKLDGSLISAVVIDNKVYCRSKNSFKSSQAIKANELIENDNELKNYIIEMSKENKVCIFELIGVDKVVVQYDKISLRGLFLRDNLNGKLIPWTFKNGCENLSNEFTTIESLENISGKNFEGVVALLDNGQLIKSKTQWYESMHDITVEKTNNLNRIIELVLNNVSDDAIAALNPNDERVLVIQEVEEIVKLAFNNYLVKINNWVEKLENGIDRKTLAIESKGDSLFGVAVRLFMKKGNVLDSHNYIKEYIRNATNSRTKAENWIKQWK